MKTEVQNKIKGADAQMTTLSKIAQIKSGAKNVRSTGGAEKKAVVTTGPNGAKFIINETQEKFEETGVKRKKRNYVMYEAKLGTETTQDITKIAGPRPIFKPKEKPKREIEPRVEERIEIKKKKKEYLDNYQYHETKVIKNPNPRFQVTVEHRRLGDIIGGTFEETSYQRQIFAQGSNRPQLTEKTTTTKTTGTANPPALRGNKSAVTLKKTTITTGQAPKPGDTTKKTTTTTNTTTRTRANPTGATAKNEKVTETKTKRRNEGTATKTQTKTETKTTTSGTRGGETGSTSTTTKTTKTTTTRTTQKPTDSPRKGQKPTDSPRKGQKSTDSPRKGQKATDSPKKTTTTTKTVTTKTTGGDGETTTKTEKKTETVTKTESKTEEKSGNDGDAAGGSSIRKKYAKGRFAKP